MTSEASTAAEAAQKLPRIEGYLASDPGNLDLLALAIDLSQAAGDLARALETILRARAEVGVAHNLAFCYVWLNRHRDACDLLAPFAEAAPLPVGAVILLLRALHHLGDLEPAMQLAQAEMARCEGDPNFLGAASLLYFDAGQAEQSARLSELALSHGVRPQDALLVAASLALGRTDADGAIVLFNEALAKNPDQGRSWSGLGLASLEKALTFMPGHVGTWHILGWCKILGQDLAGARDVFVKALELDRNFGDSHGGLAVVDAIAGQRLPAEEGIRRALGLDPLCLPAKFAQMILDGKVNDPLTFRALAARMLSGYQGLSGESLDALLDAYEKK
jgi:tetratricopeptide (TPR) repeat protein